MFRVIWTVATGVQPHQKMVTHTLPHKSVSTLMIDPKKHISTQTRPQILDQFTETVSKKTLPLPPVNTCHVLTGVSQDRWRYSPELGNVAFGSAVHGWAFRLERGSARRLDG